MLRVYVNDYGNLHGEYTKEHYVPNALLITGVQLERFFFTFPEVLYAFVKAGKLRESIGLMYNL